MKNISVVLSTLALLLFICGCSAQSPDNSTSSSTASGSSSVSSSASSDSGTVTELPPAEPVQTTWEWETSTPEAQNMNADLLAQMHDVLQDTKIHSVAVVRNGVLVDEYYQEGYDAESVFRLNSCTKSFTGTLIGIAIDQGYISGVDATLSEFFPHLADTDKGDIQLRYLLTHTSGIRWREWSGTSFYDLQTSENWVDYVLSQPVEAAPGSKFAYSTGGSHLLAAILQQATGESALDFAKENLFDPLDMESVEWSTDPQGIIDGGNGIAMNTRDAAKFGQLFLNQGVWEGEQVVPREWVAASTQPYLQAEATAGEYGYQWWIQQFGGYDAYYAMGWGAQFIFVVPDLQLVAVFTADYPESQYAAWPYFTDYIIAACEA